MNCWSWCRSSSERSASEFSSRAETVWATEPWKKNAEQRTHGRVARGIGQGGEDFGSRSLAPGVEDIHDLAFASAQVQLRTHNMLTN